MKVISSFSSKAFHVTHRASPYRGLEPSLGFDFVPQGTTLAITDSGTVFNHLVGEAHQKHSPGRQSH
jgi:hypothetical protein